MATEVSTLEGGDKIRTHTSATCRPPCSVHHRSDHSMRAFPQHFQWDRGIMERTCPHGVSHPDPDDYLIREGIDEGQHDCDGCCCNRNPIRVIASIGIPLEKAADRPRTQER